MRVLVTGGTGSLGHALIPKLLSLGHTPVIFSRDEYKQSLMKAEYPDVRFILGDVRHRDHVFEVVRGIRADSIIHAAALKQISRGEESVQEFVSTNYVGSTHVAAAARTYGRPAVLISSDKAVYPINVYGMSKALAEKFFLTMGLSVVRYGNVLGSRGSILEVVDRCMEGSIPIPITDTRMTRFWWTMDEAADFVIKHMLESGLHIPKLKGRLVVDVIGEHLKEKWPGRDYEFETIGIQAGEKMHERMETLEENPESKASGE